MTGFRRRLQPEAIEPCDGYAVSRFNAIRHGVLSVHTVLPWEDRNDYEALQQGMVSEHAPQGPTEEHLAKEIADTDGGEVSVDDLRKFLNTRVADWYDRKLREMDCRHLVRDQALGESLDPEKFEKLARYEVHLDRKVERMLSMLVRLQEIRGGDAMR